MTSTNNHTGSHPAVPTPHFSRVKRKVSSWKTQHVAAAGHEPDGGQMELTEVLPEELLADIASSQLDHSTEIVDRVDLNHTQTVTPHFHSGEKKDTAWVADYGAQLVPIGDEAMRPPTKTVPDAETFRETTDSGAAEGMWNFRPNWEVEQFLWPEVTTELLYQHEQLFSEFASLIDDTILIKQKRLLVTGVCRGEGRTTLSITLARKLANDGNRVLVVDADLVNPGLADSMGIETGVSWLTDHAPFEPSAELLVGNAESNVCVMPLAPSNRAEYSKHAYEIMDALLRKLEKYFDVIILEFGPISQIDLSTFRSMKLADAGLFVHDPLVSNVQQYADAFQKFQAMQLSRFGFVENSAVQALPGTH